MRLKLFKVFNIIWLVAIILVAVGSVSTSGNFGVAMILVLFIPALCVAAVGINIKKKYKNDFLIPLILGIVIFAFSIFNITKMSVKNNSYWFWPFAALPFVLCILQLIVTVIALFSVEGRLFDKNKAESNTASNIAKASLKNLLYVLAYVLLIIPTITSLINVSGSYFNGVIFYLLRTIAVALCSLFIVCSFMMCILNKRDNKVFVVFTIIALATYFAFASFMTGLIARVASIVCVLVIASTLLPKEKAYLKKSKVSVVVLIVVGLAIIALLIDAMHTSLYYNETLLYRYHIHPLINYLGYESLFPKPTVFVPLIGIVLAIFIKNIDKRFIKRMLLVLIITTSISMVLCATFMINGLDYWLSRHYEYAETRSVEISKFPGFLFVGFFGLLLVVLIAAYIYFCFAKTKEKEEPQVVEETTTAISKKIVVLDVVRKVVLLAGAILFAFLLPVCADEFNNGSSILDFTRSGTTIILDYDRGMFMGNKATIGNALFAAIGAFLGLNALILPVFFVVYYFAFYGENKKLSRVFAYGVCAHSIIAYLFMMVLVILGNIVQKLNFYSLAFIPVIFFTLAIVIITLDANQKKLAFAFKNYKETRTLHKEQEKEKKQKLQEERKVLAEKEKEEKKKEREAVALMKAEEKRKRELENAKKKEELEMKKAAERAKERARELAKKQLSSEQKIRQIRELAYLKEDGVLTEEEFTKLKDEIINGGNDYEK